MRRILILGVICLLLACSKEENKMWDIDAMFALNSGTGVRASSTEGHLTPLEIVQKAEDLRWRYYDPPFGEFSPSCSFSEQQRDYAKQRLLMFGFGIISPKIGTGVPTYKPDFVEGWDMVLVSNYHWDYEEDRQVWDTIAYIPNSVLRAAKEIIKPAFEAGDYATCYKTFDEAFTFIPITGAEWRALKDKDEN